MQTNRAELWRVSLLPVPSWSSISKQTHRRQRALSEINQRLYQPKFDFPNQVVYQLNESIVAARHIQHKQARVYGDDKAKAAVLPFPVRLLSSTSWLAG